MEPERADRIFRRSVEKRNLRYTEFYGDGDSESFTRVKGVYEDDGIEMETKECIGHVQKRVGTALRKLKRENPGLGGKGKVTVHPLSNVPFMTTAQRAVQVGAVINKMRQIRPSCTNMDLAYLLR